MNMKETDAEKDMEITKGSKYLILHEDGAETTGIFKGYSMIGSETTLVVDSKGSVIYIPASRVLSVKLLESVKEKEQKKKEEPGVYYG